MRPTDRQMMIITLIRRSLAAPVSCLSLCHRELPFSPNDHNWNDKPRIFDRGGQVSAHWNKRNHFGGNANGPRKRAVWCVSNWGCLIMLLIYHRRHNVRIIYSNENFICFNYRYESGRWMPGEPRKPTNTVRMGLLHHQIHKGMSALTASKGNIPRWYRAFLPCCDDMRQGKDWLVNP